MNIDLLGKVIPIDRRPDVGADDWVVIEPRLVAFAGPINTPLRPLSEQQRVVILQTNGIIVFRRMPFGDYTMTRSFMDRDNALFHWHVDDLTHSGYRDPAGMATYYFHDAFHVLQYRQNDRAEDLDSLVRREISATLAQIEFGERAGSPKYILDDLRAYANDRARIEARLSEGTGFFLRFFGRRRYREHFPVLEQDSSQ